jgi:hypothetical protein
MWNPRRVAVLGYTSTGNSGDTAVIGYIPFPDIPDVSLMDVASRHKPGALYGSKSSPEGCWLTCLGYSSRLVLKPNSIDHQEVSWTLETEASVDVGGMYGYGKLVTGRFLFDDPALVEQARSVLWEGDIPEMSAEDKPAHV